METTHTPLPTRAVLKAQAKRLRQDLADKGQKISHATALETIAHQAEAADQRPLPISKSL